jgi:hypothetical protein
MRGFQRFVGCWLWNSLRVHTFEYVLSSQSDAVHSLRSEDQCHAVTHYSGESSAFPKSRSRRSGDDSSKLLTIQWVFATHHDGIHVREVVELFTTIGDRDGKPQMRLCWIRLAVTFHELKNILAAQIVRQSHRLSTGLPRLVSGRPEAPPIVAQSESGGQNRFVVSARKHFSRVRTFSHGRN